MQCTFFHQRAMIFAAVMRVNFGPTVLAVVLQTGHVRAEVGRKTKTTFLTLALIAQLIINNIWLDF